MNSQTECWLGIAPPQPSDVVALHFRSVDASSTVTGSAPLKLSEDGVDGGEKAPGSLPLTVLAKSDRTDEAHNGTAQMVKEAHEQGMRDALAQSEADIQKLLAKERQGISGALEEFVLEKQRYFAGLEREVVRLSLAIAQRVLHRESLMDPTLLAGVARVALEQLNNDVDAVIRVPPDELSAWETAVPKACGSVHVVADATLENGRCTLETKSGSIEFGIRAQLQEIERGFFELLARNPSVTN